MPKANKELNKFKKVHVGLVILYSTLTLGVYLGYWFLSRKECIRNYKGSQVIPFKWWWVFTIILVLSFLLRFIGPIMLTPYGIAVFDSTDMILSFYFLGLLYYSVFRMKEILEGAYEEKLFSFWILVLFHVWYLQYKINRLEGMENDEKNFKEALAK